MPRLQRTWGSPRWPRAPASRAGPARARRDAGALTAGGEGTVSERRPQVLEELGRSSAPRSAATRRGRGPAARSCSCSRSSLPWPGHRRRDRDRAGRVAARRQSAGLAANGVPVPGSERLAGLAPDPDAANRPGTCVCLEPPPGRRARRSVRCSAASSGSSAWITCSAPCRSAGVDACGVPSRALRRSPACACSSAVRRARCGQSSTGSPGRDQVGDGVWTRWAAQAHPRARGQLHHRLRGLRRRSAPAVADRGRLRPTRPARVRPDDGPGSARPQRALAVAGQRRSRPRSGAYPDENCARPPRSSVAATPAAPKRRSRPRSAGGWVSSRCSS